MSINGTFTFTTGQADVDFWKQFLGEEVAQGFKKATFFMKREELSDGRVFCQNTSPDMPVTNSCFVVTPGVPCTITTGMGKGKLITKKTDKGWVSIHESDQWGKMEYTETMSPDGNTLKINLTKEGKCHLETWHRIIDMDGIYKLDKLNNVKEYLKKDGMPEELIATMDDYKVAFKVCDKGLVMMEWFGEHVVKHEATFDVEADYAFPMEGVPPSKYVVTKAGLGKYASVIKDAEGRVSEWCFNFTDNALQITGRNMKTGDTCSMDMIKECCPAMGTWKPVSMPSSNHELYALAGIPTDVAQKLANDFDSQMVIDEKGPMMHWHNKSKLMPFEATFKWGEETSFHDPVLKENCKIVATKNGNTLQTVQVSSQGTWITECTVGNTFMVLKTYMQGLPSKTATIIYTRQC